MSDLDRRARAEARRKSGVTVERMQSGQPSDLLHASVEERLTAMTHLCAAAWRATGAPLPKSGREHRASLPGEVYRLDHGTKSPTKQ